MQKVGDVTKYEMRIAKDPASPLDISWIRKMLMMIVGELY